MIWLILGILAYLMALYYCASLRRKDLCKMKSEPTKPPPRPASHHDWEFGNEPKTKCP
jgi:hypothetical protein